MGLSLPGGFSPTAALREAGDTLNPFNGDTNHNVFNNLGNQRGSVLGTNTTPFEGSMSNSDGKTWVFTNGSWQEFGRSANAPQPANPGSYNGGGGGTPAYDPNDIAFLDDQKGNLERQLGRTDTTLRNSLDAILQNYNKELSGANQTRSRNLEDFDDKTEISEAGRSRELSKVDTSARRLADSLRQKIGLASGSGSSAYQVTAPGAVTRQASEQRGDVLADYSSNFQELDKNKKRSEEDFNSLLTELDNQKRSRTMGAEGDIAAQRNEIYGNIGQLEGKRAAITGGGYKEIKNATNPWNQRVAQGEGLIDSLYSKYAAKYNVNPIQERKTALRDYAVDNVAVRDQAATGAEQYSPYKNYEQEDEQKVAAY